MSKPKVHKKTAILMQLSQHLATVALAIEALELVLIEKGLLKDNEVMERLEKLVKERGQSLPESDAA